MNRVGKIGAKSLYLLGITVLVFTSFFFISSEKANAAETDHLVINEIYPNQISGGSDNEWAEIYNPTSLNIDIALYSLVKITSSGTEYKKLLSNTLCPEINNYFVCDLGSGWLSNSGATLVLRQGLADVDKVVYGIQPENASVPLQGQSISRIPNGLDTDSDKNDFKIVPVTKIAENILPTPIVYSNSIIINEIVPEPEDGVLNEFIELYNPEDADVDLSAWVIDDIEGGSTPFVIPIGTKIGPKQYISFYNSVTKISLNDSGDSARLIDPNGDIKNTILYDKAERGMSYSLFDTNYKWTKVLTSNAVNIYEVDTCDALNIQLVTIAQAKTLKDGDKISISGYVTALPGVLSSQYIYIQDDTGGIQIYLYDKDFPSFILGQKIQVVGELSTISGERRIKLFLTADISILEDKKIIEPLELSVAAITEQHIGELVTTRGVVTRTSGDTFYISDGTKEIKVIIRDGTNIDKPKMRQGDTFIVTGVLSTYGGELRILPIDQNDVTLLASKGLPLAGPNIFNFKSLILNIIVWILFLIRKRRLGNLPVTTPTG